MTIITTSPYYLLFWKHSTTNYAFFPKETFSNCTLSLIFRLFDKSLVYLLPVTLLTVCWNIPKFFELYTCYLPSNLNMTTTNITDITDDEDLKTENFPEVCKYELRDDFNYCRDYLLIANFIVMALIPFLLLIIVNTFTFRIIRISTRNNKRTSKRERRDQGIARMFVFIVFVFFFCNTPRIILNIFEVKLLKIIFR